MKLAAGLTSVADGLKRYWLHRIKCDSRNGVKPAALSAYLNTLLEQAANGGPRRVAEDTPESSVLREVFPSGPPGLDEFREFAAEHELPVRDLSKLSGMIGNSSELRKILHMASRYARSRLPVLLTGETGTGKELLADFLHRASDRKGELVAVNCGALSAALLEAELFGYEPHAFTGAGPGGREGRIEAANGGTIFFDEIAELPEAGQTRLLRFLDSGELQRVGASRNLKVSTRVICATHQNLAARVAAGEFRQDLFFRIAAIELTLPPLRARKLDIPDLALHFLLDCQRIYERRRPERLSPEALLQLKQRDWPGNIRELKFVIERAFIDCPDDTITPEHLSSISASSSSDVSRATVPTTESVSRLEARLAEARASMFPDRRRWAIFLLSTLHASLSNHEIVHEFGMSEASARLRLNCLVDLGVLQPSGAKRGRKYSLLPPFSA